MYFSFCDKADLSIDMLGALNVGLNSYLLTYQFTSRFEIKIPGAFRLYIKNQFV